MSLSQSFKIAALGFDSEEANFSAVAKELKFLNLYTFPTSLLSDMREQEKIVSFIREEADVILLSDQVWHTPGEEYSRKIFRAAGEKPLVPVGGELVQNGIYNASAEIIKMVNRYFLYGGTGNLTHALRYLIQSLYKLDTGAEEPEVIALEGIFHPATTEVFSSLTSYLQWYSKYKNCQEGIWLGLLTHRSNWVSRDLAVETAIIAELEILGFNLIPVFTYGSSNPELKTKDFPDMIKSYFSLAGKRQIDALINLQMFLFTAKGLANNVFRQAEKHLQQLNIPVFRPLVSFTKTEGEWQRDPRGLMMEIPWLYTVPEMQGMIEPILVGCKDKNGKNLPIPERVKRFALRVQKWMELRLALPSEKRLAIMLHNAPCSGVEATVGMAVGLDALQSTVEILKMLQKNGWQVGEVPADGEELLNLIMERKAFSDFRWTAVEDIVAAGGCLYRLPLKGKDGYLQYFQELDVGTRQEMEAFWGPPPGEGMVFHNHFVITGLRFGNILILVEPKRGCYGAKCTGEVCKILQDPTCPPPHQYLATFHYLRNIFKAHALLHVGTHGSVEFLPGKENAMSATCYPDLVQGTLPNLYLYNAGIGTEGILAKRRTYAVILDHLPPIYGTDNHKAKKLISLIGEFTEAKSTNSKQSEFLATEIKELIAALPGAEEIATAEKSFSQGLKVLKARLIHAFCRPQNGEDHVYGQAPGFARACQYIMEVLKSDLVVMEKLRQLWQDDYELHRFLESFITEVLTSRHTGSFIVQKHALPQPAMLECFTDLAQDIREMYGKLQEVPGERESLLEALAGKFIPAGPSGMPDDNGRNIIPTGRNFYQQDIEKIPTPAAWKVGRELAEKLLQCYQDESGSNPEKIAMNMISLDITQKKGEQVAQCLYLIGVKPVWDAGGKVIDLEVIPLEELGRPRIDIIVRVSGVLRDTYPNVLELLDQAVCLVAALDEPPEQNYIKKHTLSIQNLLGASKQDNLRRRATARIFGDRPGTYGSGVDLALKASAWQDEMDLVKTFIYFSAYAYGKDLDGKRLEQEFVENVKTTQASYDVSSSKRYDAVGCDFGATVQGGFKLIRNLLAKKEIKQYYGSRETPEEIRVTGAAEKLEETLEETLFNPLFQAEMKSKGYKGAAELMHRLQGVFAWQCVNEVFSDDSINQLVELYVNNEKMRTWFLAQNHYAVEEIARRFLELEKRGKWQADPGILKELKQSYLLLEGDMEERLSESKGEIQAGTIEIINQEQIEDWKAKLHFVDELLAEN